MFYFTTGNIRNNIVTPKLQEVVNKLDLCTLPAIRKTTLCLDETVVVHIVSEEVHGTIYGVSLCNGNDGIDTKFTAKMLGLFAN